MTDQGACINCHRPHGGNLGSLMKAAPIDVCLKCHDKVIKRKDDSPVPSVAYMKEKKLNPHAIRRS